MDFIKIAIFIPISKKLNINNMNARIIIMLFFPFFSFAQAPQKINFQSILRNSSGEIVANKAVNIRISLLAGSANGSSVFTETHAKTTDASGLISIQIGMGTLVSGVFNSINWGNQAHFIKLEADFNGGSNYVVLGTQELMSVPYALYAGKTDTSVLNLTSRLVTKLNATDTASLSNRIDAKLNISDFPLGTTPGNMQYWNGTNWVNLAPGLPGQSLIITSTGMPSWSGAAYPTLTTSSVSSITSTSANSGGNISSDGGAAVTARGLVYSTSTSPTLSNTVLTIGSGTGSFSGTLTGLTPNTTYYIRAYVTNSAGTAYGNEVSFTTLSTTLSTVTDIDGNIYGTVQIGTQVWMSENLKTTRYRNGGQIPNVTDNTAWGNLSTGAWSYYNNDVSNNAIYGKLYNWYTTLGDTLCPTGWGVPTDAEWTTLTTYLGGESVAGGKMKSIGTAYWVSSNTGATNESGFSVLPGGYRSSVGSFYVIRDNAFFWSASELDFTNAWYRSLYSSNGNVYRNDFNKSGGASVRCLRD